MAAQLLVAVARLVERAQDIATDHDGGKAEPSKAMGFREDWPCALEIFLDGTDHRELGKDENGGDNGGEGERSAGEDKVCALLFDLDDENPASCRSCSQSDDGGDAKRLQHEVPDSAEGLEINAKHVGGDSVCVEKVRKYI